MPLIFKDFRPEFDGYVYYVLCTFVTVVFCSTLTLIIFVCCQKKKQQKKKHQSRHPEHQSKFAKKKQSISVVRHKVPEVKVKEGEYFHLENVQPAGASVVKQATSVAGQKKSKQADQKQTKQPDQEKTSTVKKVASKPKLVVVNGSKLAKMAKEAMTKESLAKCQKIKGKDKQSALKKQPKGTDSWPSMNEDHTYYNIPLTMEV